MESPNKERIDNFALNPFLDGPTEFLVKSIVSELAKVSQFSLIFGSAMDAYKRMDYSMRALPAVRIYNENWTKEAESWFITGEIVVDMIFPPSIRRVEQQQLQDTIGAALAQQFRRPTFFSTLVGLVPGLNELGKTFSVDKSLGFEWADDIVPLTQIRLNFRLDLRAWDEYLEAQGRTKDDPFERTLENLERIVGTIQALRDDATTELEIGFENDQT